jgi:hypothetical protein
MGLMPHPERACDELLGSMDGRYIFQSAINALTGTYSKPSLTEPAVARR